MAAQLLISIAWHSHFITQDIIIKLLLLLIFQELFQNFSTQNGITFH